METPLHEKSGESLGRQQAKLRIFRSLGSQLFAEITCRKGLGLEALAVKEPEKFPVEFDCRKADCGICLIRTKEGQNCLSPPTAEEQDFLMAMGSDSQERLACQARVVASGDLYLVPP